MNTLQKSLILIDELFASSNKEELKQETNRQVWFNMRSGNCG